MQPIPSRMLAALQGAESYTYGAQVRFGRPVASTFLQWLTPWIPVESGSVTISTTAQAWRTLNSARFLPVDIDGNPLNLMPITSSGLVSAYGREVAVRAGLTYADGTFDMIPVGIFVVENVSQSSPGYVSLGQCQDRTSRYARPLTYTIQQPPETFYYNVAYALLSATGYVVTQATNGAGWLDWDYVPDPTTGATISLPGTTYTTGDIPWDQATSAVAAAGCILYCDPYGVAQIRYVPNLQLGDPVWTFAAGKNATFYDTVRTQSQTNGQEIACSHAVVLGASIDGSSPVRADSFDLDPNSPTYWNSDYGDYAMILDQSQYISTVGSAQAASKALLAANRGAIERVACKAAPNPALEGWDLVSMTSPQSGTQALYNLEQIDLPLAPGEMTVQTRSRRLTTV
jgi:hypothetical protein